jgi:hypothetical protein
MHRGRKSERGRSLMTGFQDLAGPSGGLEKDVDGRLSISRAFAYRRSALAEVVDPPLYRSFYPISRNSASACASTVCTASSDKSGG